MSNMVYVLTTAFNCAAYVADMIKSVQVQNGDFMHYICVDGCDITLKEVLKHSHERLKIFYVKDNIGAAMCFNSLVSLVDGQIIRFDADDIMAEDTILNLPKNDSNEFGRLPYMNSNEMNQIRYAHGVFTIHSNTFKYLGGFNTDYRCAFDTELMKRHSAFYKMKPIELNMLKPFYRVVHNQSLSHCKATGIATSFRRKIKLQYQKDLLLKKYIIEFKTTQLIEV